MDVLLPVLANAEKRNLVKAQNAQKKEEIQKRLEKVQTQLGTKTKQSSLSSLTKRGECFSTSNAFLHSRARFFEFQFGFRCYYGSLHWPSHSSIVISYCRTYLVETLK